LNRASLVRRRTSGSNRAATRDCAKVAARPSAKHPQKNASKAKKAPNALAKPVRPDPSLAAIVGPEPLPRTELTKRVWAYIRERKLQDAQD